MSIRRRMHPASRIDWPSQYLRNSALLDHFVQFGVRHETASVQRAVRPHVANANERGVRLPRQRLDDPIQPVLRHCARSASLSANVKISSNLAFWLLRRRLAPARSNTGNVQ
jgi:hypothetical protein